MDTPVLLMRILRKKSHIMKTENSLNPTSQQDKDFYTRALEKTLEGAKAADQIAHRHTYNLLLAGILVSFVTGLLVSRNCRCCDK
jgi:hypothetical protein